MLGVKLEPSLAALVHEAADEDGRTVSTYLYRLIKADLIRRESGRTAETGRGYMPAGGTVMGTKIQSQMPPIVQTIDLDAPLKPQNERRKKAQHHKPQPA